MRTLKITDLRFEKWLLVPVLVLATLGAWLAFRSGSDPISPRNYERIQLGMTLEEVEAIIGLPPGYYDHGGKWGEVSALCRGRSAGDFNYNYRVQSWVGDHYCIDVHFDKEGKAGVCFMYEPQTWVHRIRARFGL